MMPGDKRGLNNESGCEFDWLMGEVIQTIVLARIVRYGSNYDIANPNSG